jgi:ABC-type Mn2+/Zn2+ transport system ATPase subunit
MIHLNREGHTLVVTTHDVEKVIAHVNRIAIHDGELKIAGPPGTYCKTANFESGPLLCSFEEKISWLE